MDAANERDVYNESAVTTPTDELVKAACEEFDQDNSVVEQALSDLFTEYPCNDHLSHVLLKVVALNRLYSTQIFAVLDLAQHIRALEIDRDLALGSPEIVDRIARITINGKERNNYSFATKYCSWHNQPSYPIWDSRVDTYLWRLQKQKRFTAVVNSNSDLWHYPTFREAMIAFRDVYRLASFSFKEIDKFLWKHGERSIEGPVIQSDTVTAAPES
jgi:hypothetical protein